MAQIDIQEKKGTPAWAWILGLVALLVVAGVVWGVMNDDDGRDDTRMGQDTVTTRGDTMARAQGDRLQQGDRMQGDQAGGALAEYLAFARQPAGTDPEMGLDHEYTSTGLQHLAAALDQVVRADTVGQRPLEERLTRVREQANRITQNPESSDHANQVREAFTEAASIIEEVRDRRSSGEAALNRRVDATREAAESIDPAAPMLEQRERVRRFFSESAQALEGLRGSRR